MYKNWLETLRLFMNALSSINFSFNPLVDLCLELQHTIFNFWKPAPSCLVRSNTKIVHYNLCVILTRNSKELILENLADIH